MLLCEKIKQKFNVRHRRLFDDYNFTITDKIYKTDLVSWDLVNGDQNLFLSSEYLNLLEESGNKNYRFRYVIVYHKKRPVAIAYFQVIDFTAELFGEMVTAQLRNIQSHRAKLFQKYLNHSKENVLMRLVTLGNNYISGEHGVAFAQELSNEKQFALISKLTEIISKEEKLHGRISATLVKDFYAESLPKKNELKEKRFLEFGVEPNMVIEVPGNIKSLSEYIGLFSKKYRNRAKNIFKLSETIEKKELDLAEIQKWNKSIFSLYEQVYNNAKFKLVKLHKDYFVDAKKAFAEQFIVNGFFKDGHLLAFNSAFLLNNDELEAHFIGFDYKNNKDFELYQNILYNLVDTAIKHKKLRVNLGRTAAEIKSTVGAKAEDLTCYVKPQNTVSKLVMRPFLSFLQPSEWVPRNPFKEELVSSSSSA